MEIGQAEAAHPGFRIVTNIKERGKWIEGKHRI
jgi:hypothetical protein